MAYFIRLIFLISSGSYMCLAGGLWTPYVADYQDSIQVVAKDGTVLKSNQVLGRKMRSSSGNEMLIRFEPTGQTGRLWEAANGKIFKLSFAEKTATLVYSGQALTGSAHRRSDVPIGTKTVSGLLCQGFPIHNGGHSGAAVGTMWVALSDDIEVAQEIDTTNWDGSRTSIRFRLTNVKVGEEPTSEDVSIPQGFNISTLAK